VVSGPDRRRHDGRVIADAVTDYWTLGATATDLGDAILVRRSGLPASTFLHRLRPASARELDGVLDAARAATGESVRQIVLDPGAPPFVEAELRVRGWTVDHAVQLVLPVGADLPVAADAPVRPAVEADRPTLRALFRADHVEEDERVGRPHRSEARTDAIMAERWSLGPAVRWFVVDEGDGAVGFFASWGGGARGIGVVEDLFVRADRRGRGHARALIATAVAAARADGAGEIVIGADPTDTPQRLYARLGFRPALVLRVATR
jgi:GNAT superfamily N-acetyltransferase